MSKTRKTVEEQPQLGGSYVRKPDGSLNRVEGTRERGAPIAADDEPQADGEQPSADSQEG